MRRVLLGKQCVSLEPFPRGSNTRIRVNVEGGELSLFVLPSELRSLATAMHDTADEMEAREVQS